MPFSRLGRFAVDAPIIELASFKEAYFITHEMDVPLTMRAGEYACDTDDVVYRQTPSKVPCRKI